MSKLADAVWYFRLYTPRAARKRCESEGITEVDIKRGEEIAQHLQEIDVILRHRYGNPEYGRWPEAARDERHQMLEAYGVKEEEYK